MLLTYLSVDYFEKKGFKITNTNNNPETPLAVLSIGDYTIVIQLNRDVYLYKGNLLTGYKEIKIACKTNLDLNNLIAFVKP